MDGEKAFRHGLFGWGNAGNDAVGVACGLDGEGSVVEGAEVVWRVDGGTAGAGATLAMIIALGALGRRGDAVQASVDVVTEGFGVFEGVEHTDQTIPAPDGVCKIRLSLP